MITDFRRGLHNVANTWTSQQTFDSGIAIAAGQSIAGAGALTISTSTGDLTLSPAANVVVAPSSFKWSADGTVKGGLGNSVLGFADVANAVNYLRCVNAVTGNGAQLEAQGSDTNVDLRLVPKGSGVLAFGTHSAIATETVTGYITVKDAAGTSRKLAVVS